MLFVHFNKSCGMNNISCANAHNIFLHFNMSNLNFNMIVIPFMNGKVLDQATSNQKLKSIFV
jgi:hypothetical protein